MHYLPNLQFPQDDLICQRYKPIGNYLQCSLLYCWWEYQNNSHKDYHKLIGIICSYMKINLHWENYLECMISTRLNSWNFESYFVALIKNRKFISVIIKKKKKKSESVECICWRHQFQYHLRRAGDLVVKIFFTLIHQWMHNWNWNLFYINSFVIFLLFFGFFFFFFCLPCSKPPSQYLPCLPGQGCMYTLFIIPFL